MKTTLPGGARIASLLAAIAVLTGCTGSITDPPARIQKEAKESHDKMVKSTSYNGLTPRIEPTVGVMATSPRIRLREELSLTETAADALARIGPPAVPQVTAMLRDPDPVLRIRAAEILSRIGPEAQTAVPDLVALLNDQDEGVRKASARALGQIGPAAASAVPALLRAAAVDGK